MATGRSSDAMAASTRFSASWPAMSWRQTPTIWSIGVRARVVSSEAANRAPPETCRLTTSQAPVAKTAICRP